MKPLLNRCAVCRRSESAHGEASVFHPKRETHKFERDESIPMWKGWHGCRRGNATHLAKNFNSTQSVEVAAKVLRHSDSGVTQVHYVEESKQVTRAREAAKRMEVENLKQQALAFSRKDSKRHADRSV